MPFWQSLQRIWLTKRLMRKISHWSRAWMTNNPRSASPPLRCVVSASVYVGTAWLLLHCSSAGWICPFGLFRSHTPALQHWIWLTLIWIWNSLEATELPLRGTRLALLRSYAASADLLFAFSAVYSPAQENLQPELLPLTAIKNHLDLIFVRALALSEKLDL